MPNVKTKGMRGTERDRKGQKGTARAARAALVPSLALTFVLAPQLPALALGKPRPPPGRTSVRKMAAKYGFPTPRADRDKFVLKSKFTELTLHADSRRMLVNGMLIWLNGGARRDGRNWNITTVDAVTVLAPLLRPRDIRPPAPTRPIAIDPGHGGEDTGARISAKILEKHLVLDLAGQILALPPPNGFSMKLTRTTDRTLTLKQRTGLARKWDAGLFVSVHMNSAPNKAAQGIETYILPAAGFPSTSGRKADPEAAPGNKYDAANSLLAYCVHSQLLAHSKAPDRGIRRARFDVLGDAPCPAVLVECGFLSNAAERNRLTAGSYRKTLARGIVAGIRDFLERTAQ